LIIAAKKLIFSPRCGSHNSDEPDEVADSEDHLDHWLAEIVVGNEFISWIPRGAMSQWLSSFGLLSTLKRPLRST
jgi:hypothetical protein